MPKNRTKDLLEQFLWGSKKKHSSLRQQVTRIIVVCCISAVTIQAIVMLTMILNQYVSQEKEDILYILESANTRMDNTIQYLEEMTLSIQHNIGVKKFLTTHLYSAESAAEQLKTVTNLFSERNRLDTQEPFVEKVYLFQESGRAIYNLYYPATVSEIERNEHKFSKMNQRFLDQTRAFYYELEENYVNLCLKLYNEDMDSVGTCIFALNRAGIEDIYSNLDKMKQCGWAICQEEEVILGRGSLEMLKKGSLEHTMKTGFGLTLYAAISPWQVYSSLGTTMLILVVISAAIIFLVSLLAYILARYFVHPLETIAEKIKLVGKGNFDTKLGEYRAEELNNISEKFNEMTGYINMLVTEVYETQLIATQAQIKYLQAQMNPHFLFNVLSMIEMKAAVNGDREVREMLFKLSKLYQGKIFRKDQHFIRLEEEMEIVDFYLSLQNSRFGDKITYSIEYEGEQEDYRQFLVPRLSIEPSVENAVCHGLEPKEGNGHIHIRVAIQDKKELSISIRDNGVGFETSSLSYHREDIGHSHVGIYNTDRMIKNLCGEAFGLSIFSSPGEGTQVLIKLPAKTQEEEKEGSSYVESDGSRR